MGIQLAVTHMPFQKWPALGEGEPSALNRQRVEMARAIQAARFADVHKANILVNGDMGPAEVQRFCQLDEAGKHLMRVPCSR